MHNITKIKIFRVLLWITWLPSLLILYPLALLRKKQASGLFFFFDRYVLGGAQKVHLDILEAVEDQHKMVFFTRKSTDDSMWSRFAGLRNTRLQDIHIWCDNLLPRLFSIHYFAFYLNRHERVRVLSSNSTFFYDMLPFLKKETFTVELLHNFTYGRKGMEWFGLLNHRYLSLRTTIDSFTREQILGLYKTSGIGDSYADRVRTIEFGITIPDASFKKPVPPLVVVYAGRGGTQKRIPLINLIAESLISTKAPVHFRFAGTFTDELSGAVREAADLRGVIGSEDGMRDFFSSAHVLLMTSAYEGFPVVIKESLAGGCIPLVPALPGILTHLVNNENSLLMTDPANEALVVSQGIAHINLLLSDSGLRERLSANGISYAKAHFDKKNFRDSYRSILS